MLPVIPYDIGSYRTTDRVSTPQQELYARLYSPIPVHISFYIQYINENGMFKLTCAKRTKSKDCGILYNEVLIIKIPTISTFHTRTQNFIVSQLNPTARSNS